MTRSMCAEIGRSAAISRKPAFAKFVDSRISIPTGLRYPYREEPRFGERSYVKHYADVSGIK